MERACHCLLDPEELGKKAEASVTHHVDWEDLPTSSTAQDAGNQVSKQGNVEDELELAGRISNARPRNEGSQATPGDDAVDSCKEQRAHETYREDVKDIAYVQPAEACQGSVEDRKKRHAAKQAHVSNGGRVPKPFNDGEDLDAKQAKQGVRNGEQSNLPRL